MSPFDSLKIYKCGFRMASRFAQCKLFKFFIVKGNQVRADEFAAIPILLPFKSLDIPKQFIKSCKMPSMSFENKKF